MILEKAVFRGGDAQVSSGRAAGKRRNRTEGFQFIKMLYRTLLENDVNEKYVNQIMDEAEKVLHNGSSVDSILSNVYQKLILKFDQPQTIELTGKKPKVIFFHRTDRRGKDNNACQDCVTL